jgi:hypothetical protein
LVNLKLKTTDFSKNEFVPVSYNCYPFEEIFKLYHTSSNISMDSIGDPQELNFIIFSSNFNQKPIQHNDTWILPKYEKMNMRELSGKNYSLQLTFTSQSNLLYRKDDTSFFGEFEFVSIFYFGNTLFNLDIFVFVLQK